MVLERVVPHGGVSPAIRAALLAPAQVLGLGQAIEMLLDGGLERCAPRAVIASRPGLNGEIDQREMIGDAPSVRAIGGLVVRIELLVGSIDLGGERALRAPPEQLVGCCRQLVDAGVILERVASPHQREQLGRLGVALEERGGSAR